VVSSYRCLSSFLASPSPNLTGPLLGFPRVAAVPLFPVGFDFSSSESLSLLILFYWERAPAICYLIFSVPVCLLSFRVLPGCWSE
jgi:hypothetical protein